MKGLELPINVLILIAIAVIVLLAVIVLFFSGFGGPSRAITLQTAVSTACAEWQRKGLTTKAANTITIDYYDANGDGTITAATGCGGTADNLGTLALKFYGIACSGKDIDIKQRVCGFP